MCPAYCPETLSRRAATLSPDNAQSQIGDEVEHDDGDFVERHAGVMDGVEFFDRDLEPFSVAAVHPVMREDEKQPPPEQQSDVDDRAPAQHVPNRFQRHGSSPG